jgi:hypothetical protein
MNENLIETCGIFFALAMVLLIAVLLYFWAWKNLQVKKEKI